MRLLITFLFCNVVYTLPEFQGQLKEPIEVLKLLQENSLWEFKIVNGLREKIVATVSMIYGTFPMFYMQAVKDISTKFSAEVAQMAEPKKAFEDKYKEAAVAAKTGVDKAFTNSVIALLHDIDAEERLAIRRFIAANAKFVDGHEILDYTDVFAPTFFRACNYLERSVSGKVNATIDEGKKLITEKLPMGDEAAKNSSEEILKDLEEKIQKLNNDVGEYIKAHFPIDLAYLVNNLSYEDLGNSTEVYKEHSGDEDEEKIASELKDKAPFVHDSLQKINGVLKEKVLQLIDQCISLWKEANSKAAENTALKDVYTAAGEEMEKRKEEFEKNATEFVTELSLVKSLKMLNDLQLKELMNVRRFVGVHAKDTLRTMYNKKGFAPWAQFSTVVEYAKYTDDFIVEAIGNVTKTIHEEAEKLISAVETTVENKDFVTFAKKIDMVIEAKVNLITPMQMKKIRQMFPVPLFLMFDDVSDEDFMKFHVLDGLPTLHTQ